ncbi:MAG: hypothetical protein QOF44_5282, partial [Streptomyces sp.]|nr:hypothetical protein [Streptomyces sp.]
MSASQAPAFSPQWLALREDADAAARSAALLDQLRAHVESARRGAGPLVVRDLGCGTGSLGRWLTGQLPGPQHWILHDRDPRLLSLAAASLAGLADRDGGPVTVE